MATAASTSGTATLYRVDAAAGTAAVLRDLVAMPWALDDDPGTRATRYAIPIGDRLLVRREQWRLLATDPSEDLLLWDVESRAALDLSGAVVLNRETLDHGVEPWVVGGDDWGSHLLQDLNPTLLEQQGTLGSWPTGFRQVAGQTWLHAVDAGFGRRLLRTDGSAAGTQAIAGIELAGFGYSFEQDGELWFVDDDSAIHRVNSAGEPEVVATLAGEPVGVLPFERGFLVVLGGFITSRIQRWDGASLGAAAAFAGTTLGMPTPLWLGDRYAASFTQKLLLTGLDFENGSFVPGVVRPVDPVVFDGSLWVAEFVAPFQNRLARIDPLSGQSQVESLPQASGYRLCATPLALAVVGGGEMRVRDRAGHQVIVPVVGEYQMAAFGDVMLFSDATGTYRVDDQGHAEQLVTLPAKDAPFLIANEREAYFQVGDTLWRTDGTPVGTEPHAVGVPPIIESTPVTCVGGRLWFAADSETVGVEPHSLRPRLAVEPISRSCATARAPRLFASLLDPSHLSLRAAGLAGGFATFFVSPPPPQAIAMQGCRVVVDPAGMEVVGPVSLQGGRAATVLTIPNSSSLLGNVLHAQLASGPSDHWLGLDLTGGLRIEFGPQ